MVMTTNNSHKDNYNMMDRKIRVKVASYALLDVLRALRSDDVKDVTITKEDGDLVLVVDTSRNSKNNDGCYTIRYDACGYIDVGGSVTSTTTESGNSCCVGELGGS